MKGFLYGKTEYDLLNNSCHLDEYISYAVNNNYTFLSITDPNLYAHKKFYDKCLANNIKPIIGTEIIIKNDLFNDVMLVYPFNNEGYKELIKLATLFSYNGYIDITQLKDYTNCYFILNFNKSILAQALRVNNNSEVTFDLERYQSLVPNYYIGITYQNPQMIEYNNNIIPYAANFGIRCVYIHENKYLNEEDKITYNTLCKINNKDCLVGNYALSDFDENNIDPNVLETSYELVNNINYNLFNKVDLPKYKDSPIDSSEYLKAIAQVGLQKRLTKFRNLNDNIKNKYFSRLYYELSIIDKMKFNDYFLIVWDYILYAKTHNILVGPARGSAAGSLVAYSLGIIEVDPLEHNLLFERFLNPERISMPDIDTDIPDDKRDELLLYVKDKYGRDNVCSIITFGTYTKKTAFRDLIKFYKFDSKIIKEVEKLIMNSSSYDEVKSLVDDNDELSELVYLVSRFENMPRNTSTHAAGIIISDRNLTEIIPLQPGLLGFNQSQIEASDLESIGLLKMDFLGIKNLSIINNVLTTINKDSSYLRTIPFNDKMVFDMLSRADTVGIFQLESQGIKNVLLKLKPTSFNDLVAVLALYRPGPMENIDVYVRRKHGEKFTYIHDSLRPILKETYGIIIYQEQIMQISQVVCGYTLGEADVLRRAISKKKQNIIEEERPKFVSRGIRNGYNSDVVNNIYDYIVKFADYGFNKSHSVAYATLAYYMLYLKAHYFNEFMANLMNNNIGSTETLKDYNSYLKSHGIKICNPDINVSTDMYVPYKNQLFMPLNSIRDVGVIATKNILAEREKGLFKDFNDFLNRTSFLDVDVLKALIFSGALDRFKKTRYALFDILCNKGNYIDKYFTDGLEKTEEYEYNILEENELYYLGINIRFNPFNSIINKRINGVTSLINIKKFAKAYVKFRNIKAKVSKAGKQFINATIYDETIDYDVVIFEENIYKKINDKDIFLVEVSKREYNGRESIVITNIV